MCVCFFFRQLRKIEEIQNALDSYGAMPKLVVHLNSGVSDATIQEALALLVKLLFGGNHKTQVIKRDMSQI